MDQRCDQRNAAFATASNDTHAWGHSKSHKDTPALPFCHRVIRAKKPKDSAYPNKIRTLSDRLRAKRLDLGLYQKDIAQLLGVSENSVCYWENGRVKPSLQWAEKLKKLLNGHR